MGKLRVGVFVLSLTGLAGCISGSQLDRRTYQEGDAVGEPRLEALPSLDVPPAELTPEMRMATLLSAESLNLDAPRAPSDATTDAIAAWSDQQLKAWVRHKFQRADAARKQLDEAAVQSHRQRIMAGAIVGLVYEDLARTLLSLPVPAELRTEPAIAQMYVELLRDQAAPYLQLAKSAYTACAGNAEQLEPLAHWSGFCLAREEQLPGRTFERGPGATRVTVLRR